MGISCTKDEVKQRDSDQSGTKVELLNAEVVATWTAGADANGPPKQRQLRLALLYFCETWGFSEVGPECGTVSADVWKAVSKALLLGCFLISDEDSWRTAHKPKLDEKHLKNALDT